MENKFTKAWGEYSTGMENPISELINLNITAFNKSIARNSKFMNDLMKVKKPEEAIDMQTKFFSESNAEAIDFFQESAEVFMKCCSNAQEQYTQAATKTSKAYQETAQNFKMSRPSTNMGKKTPK